MDVTTRGVALREPLLPADNDVLERVRPSIDQLQPPSLLPPRAFAGR